MLPKAIQPYFDDIADHINGLIYPSTNAYTNVIQFDLAEVRIKLHSYLNSREFIQSIHFIEKEGVKVRFVDLTLDPFERLLETPKALFLRFRKSNTLFFILTPGYFGFGYDNESECWNLLDIENRVKEMRLHLPAYKALVEEKGAIKQELRAIKDFIEKSRSVMNLKPNVSPLRSLDICSIAPGYETKCQQTLDIFKLNEMIQTFNQRWGELVPLEFTLKIVNKSAYVILSGKDILRTRDLPELFKFTEVIPVQFDLDPVLDTNNSMSYINYKREIPIPSTKPTGLSKCGLFSAGLVGAVVTAAAIALGVQMRTLF